MLKLFIFQNVLVTLMWLREDPTLGAKVLKEKLEEKYCIQESYYVVWVGRQMALDEVMGG